MQSYLQVSSGLGNRLAPLISMYRICGKKGIELNVLWEERTGRWPFEFHGESKQEFTELFKPIENVVFVDELPENLNVINVHTATNFIKVERDTLVQSCHFLGDKEFDKKEQVEYFQPWPRSRGLKEETEFVRDLKSYARILRPIDAIQRKIDRIVSRIKSQPTIGVHIRRSDRLPWTIPKENRDIAIDIEEEDERIRERFNVLIEFNPNSNLFIATDHVPTQKKYREWYGERIIEMFDDDFFGGLEKRGENSNTGNKNAVIDLFCLGKCQHLIGSVSSSFSNMAWILSDNGSSYEILTGSSALY